MASSTSWCPHGSHRHRPQDRRRSFNVLLSALLFASASLAQQDPIVNFCRRFGHQTAIVDDKLYIDGGLVNWNPMSTYPGNYTNTWLLWQDLAHNADDGMPQIYANLSKNNSVPSVSGGYLWADETNKYLYLFGGEYAGTPPPAAFVLYAYDVVYDYWLALGPPQQTGIVPVSYGAGTSLSARGEGYYYGGWLSNSSVSGWSSAPRATTGLVKYDMDARSWSYSTGPDSVRRAEGSMVFIPAGDGGMLVYVGGITDVHGDGTVSGQRLDTIFLYDVLSSKWYTQTASGTIPGDRRRFCAGATWAPDRSSYNIYIYGGASMPPATAGYDDLYVLTLPAFEWVRLYPDDGGRGNNTGQYPHHSLTCNVVSGAQMLIVGGTFPLSDDCDVPQQWGTHNADLTAALGGSPALWKLFAINETAYAVPAAVVSAIGGSAAGKATKTAPAGGWDRADLPVLMTRTATIASRTATRAVTAREDAAPSKLGAGAIAGIAVGCVAALVLLAAGGWTCVRRYRARRHGVAGVGGAGPQHMYEGSGPGAMIMYPSQQGYSDAASPPHGSPYSASSPYYHGAGGGGGIGGYMAAPQHSPPPPAELAASARQWLYASDARTSTGTGTSSSGTHEMVPAAAGPARSPSEQGSQHHEAGGGGGGSVWTQQVSDIQVPAAPHDGRSPRTRAQELNAAPDDEPVRPQQHTTYYHA